MWTSYVVRYYCLILFNKYFGSGGVFPPLSFYKEIEMKIIIENDLFDISQRLKEIDNGYYVVYDTDKSRYEVRNIDLGGKICFVVPYKYLDEKTLKYARKTNIKNSKKLLDEIEKNNKEIEVKNYNKIIDECTYKFKEIFNYEKMTKEMNYENAYKTKWV